jgi:hypothetical protein
MNFETSNASDGANNEIAGEQPGANFGDTFQSPKATFRQRVALAKTWQKVVAIVGILGVLTGATLFLVSGPDRSYLGAVHKLGLSAYFANDNIALAHARSVCAALDKGKPAVGYRYDKIAVESYCSQYLAGYNVIPTPLEQQKMLLAELRRNDLGGLFTSDIEAVSKSKKVCLDLTNGSTQQGPLENYIAVKIYCSSFANGYRVLRPIEVTGKFSIFESDPYSWFPAINSSGDGCSGYNGYSDINSNTDVRVTNAKGELLTATQLGAGRGSSYKCVFTYHFTVLEGQSAYFVEVGKRGKLKFSETELKTPKTLYGLGLY